MSNLENILNDLIESVTEQKINQENILKICVDLMQIVEKIPNLKGEEKKKLVVSALTKIAEKTGAEPYILNLLPTFIDIAIGIFNKDIKFASGKNCFCF